MFFFILFPPESLVSRATDPVTMPTITKSPSSNITQHLVQPELIKKLSVGLQESVTNVLYGHQNQEKQ